MDFNFCPHKSCDSVLVCVSVSGVTFNCQNDKAPSAKYKQTRQTWKGEREREKPMDSSFGVIWTRGSMQLGGKPLHSHRTERVSGQMRFVFHSRIHTLWLWKKSINCKPVWECMEHHENDGHYYFDLGSHSPWLAPFLLNGPSHQWITLTFNFNPFLLLPSRVLLIGFKLNFQVHYHSFDLQLILLLILLLVPIFRSPSSQSNGLTRFGWQVRQRGDFEWENPRLILSPSKGFHGPCCPVIYACEWRVKPMNGRGPLLGAKCIYPLMSPCVWPESAWACVSCPLNCDIMGPKNGVSN